MWCFCMGNKPSTTLWKCYIHLRHDDSFLGRTQEKTCQVNYQWINIYTYKVNIYLSINFWFTFKTQPVLSLSNSIREDTFLNMGGLYMSQSTSKLLDINLTEHFRDFSKGMDVLKLRYYCQMFNFPFMQVLKKHYVLYTSTSHRTLTRADKSGWPQSCGSWNNFPFPPFILLVSEMGVWMWFTVIIEYKV